MVLFDSLLSGVKSAAGAVVNKVGKVAATAIGAFLAPVVVPAFEIGRQFGKMTLPLTETSNLQQVEEAANILLEIKAQAMKNAQQNEDSCKKYVENCFADLIDNLQKNEALATSYGLESLKRKCRDLINSIDGAITQPLRLNLSLDNYECRRILALSSASDRNHQIEIFINKTIQMASDELANKVSRVLYQQTDDIAEFLQDQVAKQERETENAQREFDLWAQDMENNTFNQEQAQLQPAVKLYAIEQLEKIVKAA